LASASPMTSGFLAVSVPGLSRIPASAVARMPTCISQFSVTFLQQSISTGSGSSIIPVTGVQCGSSACPVFPVAYKALAASKFLVSVSSSVPATMIWSPSTLVFDAFTVPASSVMPVSLDSSLSGTAVILLFPVFPRLSSPVISVSLRASGFFAPVCYWSTFTASSSSCCGFPAMSASWRIFPASSLPVAVVSSS